MEGATACATWSTARHRRCLIDPYGLHLDWSAILQAGKSRAIDMFLNFPVMDMNRNALWRNPEAVAADDIARMTRFWGDESWRQAAYAESPQPDFFGPTEMVKQSNEAIVAAFRERLKKVAGFESVADPLPVRNSNNVVVYCLVFASQKLVAEKIGTDISRAIPEISLWPRLRTSSPWFLRGRRKCP